MSSTAFIIRELNQARVDIERKPIDNPKIKAKLLTATIVDSTLAFLETKLIDLPDLPNLYNSTKINLSILLENAKTPLDKNRHKALTELLGTDAQAKKLADNVKEQIELCKAQGKKIEEYLREIFKPEGNIDTTKTNNLLSEISSTQKKIDKELERLKREIKIVEEHIRSVAIETLGTLPISARATAAEIPKPYQP